MNDIEIAVFLPRLNETRCPEGCKRGVTAGIGRKGLSSDQLYRISGNAVQSRELLVHIGTSTMLPIKIAFVSILVFKIVMPAVTTFALEIRSVFFGLLLAVLDHSNVKNC